MTTAAATKPPQAIAGFDSSLPLEAASTIPKAWYLDASIYACELKSIFQSSWQPVARLSQLAEPGSYVTDEIAGEPVVVTRDENNQLRAFSNVCRHRAARVALEPEGRASHFRCHYHGWTYDIQGQLKGVPEWGAVCNFDREDNPLPAWHVDSWGPYVFVHARGDNPPVPLSAHLSPLPEMTASLGLKRMQFFRRKEYLLECNWKLFVDNYLDGGYHINTIHPGLAGVVDYKGYRTEIFPSSSVQISPLKQGNPDVSSVRSGQCAYYWWVFPNLMFNIYEGVMDMNLVLPLGLDRCRVIFDFYFEHTEGKENQDFIERSLAVAEQVQAEDVAICQEVQRGLSSASFNTGRFSVKREAGGYHFHRLLAARLRDAQLR